MRILLVEDNTLDADLTLRALAAMGAGVSADWVQCLAQAYEVLAAPLRHDLLLTDLSLPDGSGQELLLDIRARELPLAVVVLTSAGDEQVALAALKAGADDYLPKSDAYEERLAATLTAALARSRLDHARRGRRLRVLYAEPNPGDVDLTRRHLERHAPHIALEVADHAAAVLQRLPPNAQAPCDIDVLMLDYRLIGESGLEVLKRLREDRGLDLPVVMVTGQGTEDIAAQAMRLGATDYLLKHDAYLHAVPQALESAFHRVMAQREHAALRVSEERLSLVLRGSNDAPWDIDVERGTVYLSPRWWQMAGRPPSDAPFDLAVLEALFPPDDREPFRQRFRAVLKSTAQTFEFELRIAHVDGHAVPVLARGFVLRNEQGRVLRMAGVNTDLTERKRAEAEIQALNATLERRVAERTRELELANRELEAFSSSVSHDLRAPVRAIDALGALLLERESAAFSDEGRRMLGLLRDSARRMGSLVDDLLRFARTAREPLRRSSVQMNALVRHGLDELDEEIKARAIEVVVADLPAGEADLNLLRQVWANLLSNAVKYTRRQARPRIEIGVRQNGPQPVYFVKDNGAGFDMQYADRLFGVFQRLHRADEFEGTGVGLATAARIVERHGGRIWAEAAPQRGATFYFHLGSETTPA